jgi:ATP adenylyltransferase/5',5'''-P-1,P-4-tetraphosphate phosphorylase II
MTHQVQTLFEQQTTHWETARKNYEALRQVQVRICTVNGYTYKVQFNPARIISSGAKVDAASIQQRACFLCAANLPAEQQGVSFGTEYTILVNPFPIFPKHLTIPVNNHIDQLIAGRLGDMLDLTKALSDYILFYNGPKCGASAPDHLHFQAGNKGFLPIEAEVKSHPIVLITQEG